MRNSRQGQLPSDLAWLIDELNDLAARLKTVEAPSGEALSSTVVKLQALVTDIQAQLDAWVATRWTNAQIVSQISSQINSTFGSNVGFGGTITSPVTYATNLGSVAGNRRTMWMHESGLFGFASSSRERKVEIEALHLDVDAVLSIEPKTFRYREAVRAYDETPEDERGPEPNHEIGFIAEELVDAGFAPFVFRGSDGGLEGIEYSMWVVAQQAALRTLAARLDRLERTQ